MKLRTGLCLELGILINARGPRPIWPAAGRVRVEEFENLQWRVRVRVKIILSGAGAGQSNLSRGYSLTRKFKKKRFFFLKKMFFFYKKYIKSRKYLYNFNY